MKKVIVPSDGTPMSVGFREMITVSPDGQNEIVWTEDYEPPHASYCFFEVTVNQLAIDTYPIGESHAWSPDSAYFSLTNGFRANGRLRIYRLSDLAYYTVAKGADIVSLNYPTVTYFDYATETELVYVFSGDEQWVPLLEKPTTTGHSTFDEANLDAESNQYSQAPVAPLGRRFVAFVADVSLFILLSGAVVAAAGSAFRSLGIDVTNLDALLIFMMSTMFFLYFVVLGRSSYGTPGKAILKLRLETLSGERSGYWRCTAREVLKVVSLVTGLIVLSCLLMLLGKRPLHDWLSSTTVGFRA